MTSKEYKFDAKGQILGRVATQAAAALRGKNNPDFAYNTIPTDKVIIFNAKEVRVTGKKPKQKTYYRHSGYLGGIKSETYEEMFKKDPKKVILQAVKGMLPKNRLQATMLNNLTIHNGEIDAKDNK